MYLESQIVLNDLVVFVVQILHHIDLSLHEGRPRRDSAWKHSVLHLVNTRLTLVVVFIRHQQDIPAIPALDAIRPCSDRLSAKCGSGDLTAIDMLGNDRPLHEIREGRVRLLQSDLKRVPAGSFERLHYRI